MNKTCGQFQVFAKPVGPVCNLACQYCYYLDKKDLYPADTSSLRMSDEVLERYIARHIEASTEQVIRFCWHGGEPTLYGLDGFQKIVDLQRKHLPAGRRIANGMQTNGTLLDEAWCRFLAVEQFAVGISVDGPKEIHDKYRIGRDGQSVLEKTLHGYEQLKSHGVHCEILCAVNAYNVRFPMELYDFFRSLAAPYLSFLPVVNRLPDGGACSLSVPADAWGTFLCTIFDMWVSRDIGKVKVQIFEEATRTAFGQEHTLCIFKQTCGNCPVVEHNGDFYACDHFVDAEHRRGNITETPLADLLDSPAQRAFGQAKLADLPVMCKECDVRPMCNGGCLKNRFIATPDGQPGLNYLCAGYKKFFTHCKPFVSAVAAQWQQHEQQVSQQRAAARPATGKVGRNDPCPCGSGKKYKRCCMGK